jgi:hypothetical protein
MEEITRAAGEQLKSVDAAVAQINTLSRDTMVDYMIKVGKIIMDTCFDGDIDAWKARGASDAFYGQLAGHPSMALKKPALTRAIGIYVLEQQIGVSARKHLTVTHLRAVLGLPLRDQKQLLTKAEGGRNGTGKLLTSREIEVEAAKVRREKVAKGRGRKRLLRFVKTLNSFKKMEEDPDEYFADLDKLGDLPQSQVRDLHKRVIGLKLQFESLQKKLEGRAFAMEALPDEPEG